jgi:hypothetical protein
MKRTAAFILLVAALAGSTPAGAQIFMGPNSTRRAQKAVKKQQKAQSKQETMEEIQEGAAEGRQTGAPSPVNPEVRNL